MPLSAHRPVAVDKSRSGRGTTVAGTTVARSADEVEQLRAVWSTLPVTDIDADLDYFMTVVAHSPRCRRPHVALIDRPGRDPILVVARIEDLPMRIRLGYRVLAAPTLRALVVSFDGVIGVEDEQDAELVIDSLQGFLDDREADVLLWPKVDVDHPLHAAARRRFPSWRRGVTPAAVGRWTASVAGTPEDFVAHKSSKARQQLRYYDRKLRKTHGDDLAIRRLDRPEDLDRICRDVETVAVTTYQYALGTNPVAPGLARSLVEVGLQQGWFAAWVLYVGDEPIAFWLGTRYGSTFATGTPGFNPAYSKQRVGTFTMLQMIEDLCADPTLSRVDFGHGDAEYKEFFAEISQHQQDLMVYASRPRALMVCWAVSAMTAATSVAKRVLASSSRTQQWRRSARDKLVQRGRASSTDGSTER